MTCAQEGNVFTWCYPVCVVLELTLPGRGPAAECKQVKMADLGPHQKAQSQSQQSSQSSAKQTLKVQRKQKDVDGAVKRPAASTGADTVGKKPPPARHSHSSSNSNQPRASTSKDSGATSGDMEALIKQTMTGLMQSFEQNLGSRLGKLESAVSEMQTGQDEYYTASGDYEYEADDQHDYDDDEHDEYADFDPSGLRHGAVHDVSEDESEHADEDEPEAKRHRLSGSEAVNDQEGKKPSKLLDRIKVKYGIKEAQALDEEIVDVVTTTLTQSLSDDELSALVSKYDTPKNCPLLTKVKINKLIWDKLEPTVRTYDSNLQKIQGAVMTSVIALSRVLEKVVTHQRKFKCSDDAAKSMDDILDTTSDALSLACVANSVVNNKRREHVKTSLNDDYKGLCSSATPVTTELFGDDVTKQVKDLAEVSKVGKNLAAAKFVRGTKKSRPPYRGRGRGLFRGRGRGFYHQPYQPYYSSGNFLFPPHGGEHGRYNSGRKPQAYRGSGRGAANRGSHKQTE